jgi:hypothetical protein
LSQIFGSASEKALTAKTAAPPGEQRKRAAKNTLLRADIKKIVQAERKG